MAEGVRPTECDTRRLMRQLARMANMEFALIRRMVLVLDPEDIPRLFVTTNLSVSEEALGEGATEGVKLAASGEPCNADLSVEQRYMEALTEARKAVDLRFAKERRAALAPRAPERHEGKVETTSMQNEAYRTYAPKPAPEFEQSRTRGREFL